MKNKVLFSVAILLGSLMNLMAQRNETQLKKDWQFAKDTITETTVWESVNVPHDWAIYGPFDMENDLQVVAVEQNGEQEATLKTGRTGGLPYYGKGFYKTTFDIADTLGKSFTLVFDGAMSHPVVKVNGKEVGKWAYGYNAFEVNLDGVVKPGVNSLEVDLYNMPKSSRWYPGAGLYRNVTLVETSKIHVPVWGTYLTTPIVTKERATVKIETTVVGATENQKLFIETDILDPKGQVVASQKMPYYARGQKFTETLTVNNPDLWSPENPALYTARTTVSNSDGKIEDVYNTRFGIRSLEYRPGEGFFLNGELTKFKGVNNHHDLGPLGAAVNRSAIRYQLELLKDMGVNAIRTSHNMPAQELVELADEMGFMLMVEPFDDWGFRPKSENGYGTLFNEWAEKDMVNMIRHFRNNPSVVMWSIGNEVPSQWGPIGMQELTFLQDIAHREDPTRPVTCGMDQIYAVMDNGFAAALDIPSFNYKPQHYERIIKELPQGLILGSETASTVSSRGVYQFPMEVKADALYPDHQSSSYDVEFCSWSNIPDLDFAADDDLPYILGQFVWTGFDYLGEPSPYDTNAWPNHSSMFGIIDLASLPKDRYYLYRSQWNKNDTTLHVLPHWNWEGREGETTPVMVYTSLPKAELFVNGVSKGVREKNDSSVMTRYRLIWDDVVYEPGELFVQAYDEQGNPVKSVSMKTAGKADHIVLTPNHPTMKADGEDLVYVTVQIADKNGVILPTESREVKFKVTGDATFLATANGDPTSLRSFQEPVMDLFSGACTVILKAGEKPGVATLTVTAKGVKKGTLKIDVLP
ncbi:MAG: DUF4982 domain-containing protein [Muribaculaceae bacterium]|nr:DUF4982 domain-containing protein [Muribaculaceae bacterium]